MVIPFKRCSHLFGAGTWMDLHLELALFLLATFAGALVAGLSGFAFGLVAASIWLYILTPLQTATLIIAFGLIVQGYAVWKLRRALDWTKALAVPAWGCDRRPRRRPDPDLVQSGACADGRRGVSGALQSLCAVSPADSAGQSSQPGSRRRGRIPQRRARRHDRSGRNPRHHLVRPAWLAQGRAARGVSADRGRHLPDECAVDRRQRRHHA